MELGAKFGIVLLGLSLAAVPVSALAQQTDAPPAAPTYARPAPPSSDETVKGRVISFDGAYNLQVRDDRGFIDSVQLKQGTIINPTGIRLSPGMSVTVYGANRGPVLLANQIDTPYQTYGDAYAYGYGYPYGGYPAFYGYGPTRFSVGFGFGGFGGGRFGGYGRFR